MYLLQETLFPARGLPEDLNLRINRPPFMRSVALSATKGQEPGLRLDERDVLSTDTYSAASIAPTGRPMRPSAGWR